VSSSERDVCLRLADECLHIARRTPDQVKAELLLLRAQEWTKLAHAPSDEEFEELVRSLHVGMIVTAVRRQPVVR